MNNVSFQGNITVTTWNKTVSSFTRHKTTKAQDKLLKNVVKDFADKEVLIPLSKKNTNFIFKLIEKITGKSVRNINNEKTIFNGKNRVIISDKNPALFDGVRVEMDFS